MGVTIGAACGLVVAVAWAIGLMRPLDLRLHDWYYRLRGPVKASDRIAVVEIDDQTIRALGDVWPMPRRNYAIAIDAFERAGAEGIAFDLLFLGDNTEDPVGDQLLASVAAENDNLVLAIGLQRSDAPMTEEMKLLADSSALTRHGRLVSRQHLAVAQSASLPYADLLAAIHDIGHTSVLVDDDGVVRRVPHYIRFGKHAYSSLVTRLLEVAARRDSTVPTFDLAPEGIVMNWKGHRSRLPSDEEGATSIAFAGEQGAFKNRYSMLQVMQWYRDDDTTSLIRAFRGKLVMMGSTAVGQHASDVGSTPYSSISALVYIHANAVNAALRGRFLRSVPAYWVIIGMVLLGVALGLVCSRLSLVGAGLAALGVLLVLAAVNYGLFVFADVDLPALGVLLVPPMTWAAVENAWGRETERRARERAKELQVARSIQEHLLPSAPPKIAGLDVSGRNIPAASIGGDYFDWITLEDGSLVVVVGDVSGHGIPAALLMAHIHASLHAVATAGRAPQEMVECVNRSLARAALPGKFATFFLGVISVDEQRLRYCNAGHNAPLLLRAGKIIELGANGVPLAVLEDMPYSGAEEAFVPGDTLVIYSDGIVEAPMRAQPKQFYGDERLQERALAFSAAHLDAAGIVEQVLADVRVFAGDGMHVDDVTLLIVRRT